MSRRKSFNFNSLKNLEGVPATMTKKRILEILDADSKAFYGADTKLSRNVRKLDVAALRQIYSVHHLWLADPISLRIDVVESHIRAALERKERYG